MGGTVKCLFRLSGLLSGHRGKKRRMQLKTVELRVRMDCESCEQEVRKALFRIRGVQHVEVYRGQQRVAVTGNADPDRVLRKVQSTGKKAEMWPHSPYSMVVAYDKWTHACSVRNVEVITTDQITSLFSDDNRNACFVM